MACSVWNVPCASGEALTDHFGVFVDEDSHVGVLLIGNSMWGPEILSQPNGACGVNRTLRLAFDRFHDLLRAVLEVVGGDHVKAGGVDDLLALFDVRAFQADNQRHLETQPL